MAKLAHTVLGVACALFCQSSDALAIEESAGGSPEVFVEYFLQEVKKTEMEEHRVLTQFSIDGSRNLAFDYSDWVTGAKSKKAVSKKFRTSFGVKLSDEDGKRLAQQLTELNVFQWKSEPEPAETPERFEEIVLEVNGTEVRRGFYAQSPSPERLALRSVLMDIVKRNGLDQPEDKAKSTVVTEGDLEPARAVPLKRLIQMHEQYHGKRVSVVGFFDGSYPEQQELFIDKEAAEKRLVDASVWRGEPSSFMKSIPNTERKNIWLRVEGVFLWGHYGHKGGLQGMIDRVTKLEILPGQPR